MPQDATRIVMVGDRQIRAMVSLYARFAGQGHEQSLKYIDPHHPLSAEDRRAIETANIIVEQVRTTLPEPFLAGLAISAERIRVPSVNCAFMWPFGGQPHPANPTPPFRKEGPYGVQMGDAYLNRLVTKRMSPDEAAAAYCALDVDTVTSLDRFLDLTIGAQRARDALTGFQIAPLIETHYQREQLFLTPDHPNIRVTVELASQLFGKLDVDAAHAARMRRCMTAAPFPSDELPVHPTVADHFGLEWTGEDRRYRFLHEGCFTFREFAKRYVACAWNAALDEGVDASWSGDPARALRLLSEGLLASPDSAHGYWRLGAVLERMGRSDDAIGATRRATAIDPNEAKYRLSLALQLLHGGDARQTEREMRFAAALDPFDPETSRLLAEYLRESGYVEEAAAIARQALLYSPYVASLHQELGQASALLGDDEAAAESFRLAASLDPSDSSGATTGADQSPV